MCKFIKLLYMKCCFPKQNLNCVLCEALYILSKQYPYQ